MPKGILFWVIFIIAFIVGLWWNKPAYGNFLGNCGVIFILLFLLGWQVFGFVVQ